METSTQLLYQVYNFIESQQYPPIELSLDLICEFYQIKFVLEEIVTINGDVKEMFVKLQEFISVEVDVFGPKKFKKMIKTIFLILTEYLIGKLRNHEEEKVLLCLTYYERSIHKYFNLIIQATISLIYALCYLNLSNITMASQKVQSCKNILKASITQDQKQQHRHLIHLVSIFQGIIHLKLNHLSKSKNVFEKMLCQLTIKIEEEKKILKTISHQTTHFFALSIFYLAENNYRINDMELFSYYLTHFIDFSLKNIENASNFVDKYKSKYCYEIPMRVKLSRIENKIEKLKSLHSITKPQRITKPQTALYNTITQFNKQIHSRNEMAMELDKILVKKENNDFRMKQRAVRKLKKKIGQKKHDIKEHLNNIMEIEMNLQICKANCNTEQLRSVIQNTHQEKINLKKEVDSHKWNALQNIRQTFIIQQYLKGMVEQIKIRKCNRFSDFIRSASLLSLLKLMSFVKRKRSGKRRLRLKKIRINGILHMMEESVSKANQEQYEIEIYRIEEESSCEINQNIKINKQIYEELTNLPLLTVFQIVEGQRLLTLKDYFESKWIRCQTLYLVKKLIWKLKHSGMKNRAAFEKRCLNITYDSNYTVFKVILLVKFVPLQIEGIQSYQVTIERVDKSQNTNTIYHFPILETFHLKQCSIDDQALTKIVLQHLNSQLANHKNQIEKMQRLFKRILSRKIANQLKKNITISTIIIKNNIFTLFKRNLDEERTLYIENLKTNQRVIAQNFNYQNISFLNKMRNILGATNSCSEQLKLIRKKLKMKQLMTKILTKSKSVRFFTDFETTFKKKLCFCKLLNEFLYKGRLIHGKMMFMLCVSDFCQTPRPYLFRAFTIEAEALISVDFSKILYSKEKLYLESNLFRINAVVNFLNKAEGEIVKESDIKDLPCIKTNHSRKSSRVSNISNSSLGSSFSLLSNTSKKKRQGTESTKMRSNSFFKKQYRISRHSKVNHKLALKNEDVLKIKRWIENNRNKQLSERESSGSESLASNKM